MAKFSKGIVITTSKHTREYLKPLLESIKNTKYKVIIFENDYTSTIPNNIEYTVEYYDEIDEKLRIYESIKNNNNGWELAGIKCGKENFDEFIHLMDSTLIKDISLFDKLFEMEGNVFLTQGGYHYMGKFVSNTLPDLPNVSTKQEAIVYELHWLPKPYKYFEPDLPVHTDQFEEKFGQRRMKLENDFIIKWKGTYFI
jgi:hypothetical protein